MKFDVFRRAGWVVALCVAASGCVETRLSIRLQKDGSGEATLEQYIPTFLLGGTNQGARFFSVENNDLLYRTESEARKLTDEHSGLGFLAFHARDISGTSHAPEAQALGQGARATRTQMSFSGIEALDTKHFQFALIPEGNDQYVAFRISKRIREQYLDKSNGGMGPILSSVMAGRFLTVYMELPSRVLDTNATTRQWNVVEWKIPLGAIYNLVQDEIVGWAKITGSDGLSVGKMQESVRRLMPSNEWRDPKNFAPYFLLPTEEPPPRPRAKVN